MKVTNYLSVANGLSISLSLLPHIPEFFFFLHKCVVKNGDPLVKCWNVSPPTDYSVAISTAHNLGQTVPGVIYTLNRLPLWKY